MVAEWGHPGVADDAALIVSELATNAVRYGRIRGRLFRVHLTLTKTTLRIAVADPKGERLPQPRQPSPDDRHGRGLLIVRAVAARWGVRERTSARRSGPNSTWPRHDRGVTPGCLNPPHGTERHAHRPARLLRRTSRRGPRRPLRPPRPSRLRTHRSRAG
ncbi:ATP-binding protein [Streptomyces sp. NPDC021115]